MAIAQFFVEWMQQPAVTALDLRSDGELIVFLRQALAILLDDLADGNAPKYRRGDG
ncbi:hypothetical protein D1872_350800 [compost metagenome]